MSDKDKSVFEVLSMVDVSQYVRQKGKFWYLPWSVAVREVAKRFPSFTWEVVKFDGTPFYTHTGGSYVEVAVQIEDIKRTQMLPILDFKNQPVSAPSSTEVNKAHQRALTKAIALHGLGLELWAGEDFDIEGDKLTKPITVSKEDKDTLLSRIESLEVNKNQLGDYLGFDLSNLSKINTFQLQLINEALDKKEILNASN